MTAPHPFDPGLDLGLSPHETAALQRIAADLGLNDLTEFLTVLLRDVAAAELDPEGWQSEAIAEWLQFRIART